MNKNTLMVACLVAMFSFGYVENNANAQQYEYSVTGTNEESGQTVYGDVDTDGQEVTGYIVDEDGNEKYFDGEFVDKGVIEGYNEDGEFVTLETD